MNNLLITNINTGRHNLTVLLFFSFDMYLLKAEFLMGTQLSFASIFIEEESGMLSFTKAKEHKSTVGKFLFS